MFENRVLRRILGPNGDEVIAGYRQLHSEELHNMYLSPSITRAVKSKGMKWTVHVANVGRRGIHIGL
jgi:hypothetical protein